MDRPYSLWNRPRTVALRSRAVARLLLGGLLSAVVACGGGGGKSGPTEVQPPVSGIVYTASGAGGANTLNLVQGTGSTTNTLVLDLQASQVQDLYGVAFNLSYPSAILHFAGATEDTFLSGGGAVRTSLQAIESPTGTLIVGLSRFGAVPGVQGTGAIITLRFTSVATGQGTFAFSRNSAVNSFGTGLSGLTWSAGTVKVTL